MVPAVKTESHEDSQTRDVFFSVTEVQNLFSLHKYANSFNIFGLLWRKSDFCLQISGFSKLLQRMVQLSSTISTALFEGLIAFLNTFTPQTWNWLDVQEASVQPWYYSSNLLVTQEKSAPSGMKWKLSGFSKAKDQLFFVFLVQGPSLLMARLWRSSRSQAASIRPRQTSNGGPWPQIAHVGSPLRLSDWNLTTAPNSCFKQETSAYLRFVFS